MAATLRCLTRAKLTTLKRTTESLATSLKPFDVNAQIQIRNYKDPVKIFVTDIDVSKLPEFETSNDPKEWYYVERLFPLKTVPEPKKFDGAAPSGWIPPREEGKSHPYYIPRTKNHMLPVYLYISFRGAKHVTVIKNIEGDICRLEQDVKKYVEQRLTRYYKKVPTQIHEMCCQVKLKGDHVSLVKQWMISKGF